MKRFIFSCIFILSVIIEAQAACQWGYINALNLDIKYARGLLDDYAVCRGDCQDLERNLSLSIVMMNESSSCGGHIVTRGNQEMINFVASRFKLIQKQKLGSSWSEGVNKPSVVASVAPAATLKIDRPVFIKPVRTPIVLLSSKQTSMDVPKEAYTASWDDAEPTHNQRNIQRNRVARQARFQQAAKQRQIANQRLIQQRKQALIQQKQWQFARARQQLIKKRLHQERLTKQRVLQRRALVKRLAAQRIQQRKLAWAKRRAQ